MPKTLTRQAARLLIVNELGHVLLVRYQEHGRAFWATPRGGLEEGESWDQAAERGAAEEVGLRGIRLEPLWDDSNEFRARGRRIRQEERYFLCRTQREHVAQSERIAEAQRGEGITEWRWWSPEDLEHTDEPVIPADLAVRLRGMSTPPRQADAAHISAAEALGQVPGPNGERFATLFEHGTLSVEMYAPRGHDPQQPHRRDEVYVVARGTGIFWDGESRRPFSPGDFLFVAAGRPHRFEEFSDDLAVWVLFYGPEGGERTNAR